jgi:hypothetical protein
MNGVKLLECDIDRDNRMLQMQASKLSEPPRDGRETSGDIAIRGQGGPVTFRNLRSPQLR